MAVYYAAIYSSPLMFQFRLFRDFFKYSDSRWLEMYCVGRFFHDDSMSKKLDNYRTYWNSTRGYYFYFKVYVRLINGRGFNMEEVIIFTEKKHTQKIAFLYGIFSEKNSYIIINLYWTIYMS